MIMTSHKYVMYDIWVWQRRDSSGIRFDKFLAYDPAHIGNMGKRPWRSQLQV